jgi:hypothetical protein
MALTSEEESKLKAIIAAFDGGQQVDDLPQSDMSATDKIVEVFDKKSGRSEQMSLKSAVQMGQHPWCGRVWNLDNATPIQRQISCNIQNDNKTCVNTNIYSI